MDPGMQAASSMEKLKEDITVFYEKHVIGLSCIGIALVTYAGCVFVAMCCRQGKHHGRIQNAFDYAMSCSYMWHDLEKLGLFIKRQQSEDRYATFGFWHLLANRPWLKHARPEEEPTRLSPNREWMGGRRFPNGQRHTKNDVHMMLSLWIFLFRMSRPYAATLACVILGLEPAVTAQIYGGVLASFTPGGSKRHLITYVVIFLCVKVAQDAFRVMYESNVPGAGVRNELRQRLQRQFLAMRGDLARKWPPVRCATVLDYDVKTVSSKSWFSFFTAVQNLSALLSLLTVIVYNRSSAKDALFSLQFIVQGSIVLELALLALFGGAYALVRVRRANYKDLESRNRDWNICWIHLASLQIKDRRDRTEDWVALDPMEHIEDDEDDVQLLGDALGVFFSRFFHAYFIRLVCEVLVEQGAQLIVGFTLLRAGLRVIDGRCTVAEAIAIVSSVKELECVVRNFVDVLLNVHAGHPSLRSISEILNLDLDAEDDTNAFADTEDDELEGFTSEVSDSQELSQCDDLH
eukprot:TRINITY_DN12760_c0_g1_i3.p1 TRINITY_DN12760_c0_g1~~TRINITY_DN12760_c0_g1_i3.p1  ORF type:complete len:519 (+),score=46.89 TRINITY_DN12760_c0_g1_i3:219-1775(+)